MEKPDPEYHGSVEQQAVQSRAAELWTLLGDDPRFVSHGRAIGVDFSTPDAFGLQLALARLQGVASCEFVPNTQVDSLTNRLERNGFNFDLFNQWHTRQDAVETARAVLKERPLPDDLSIAVLDSETPARDVSALDQLTQSCDVLLPCGDFIRGKKNPAVCVIARDESGRPVCTSAAITMYHHDHPKNHLCWWGMLATSADRRGEGLALIMGARSIIEMNQRFGFTEFFTGIRQDNKASQNLCSKLGLERSDNSVVIAIDPAAFSGTRVTK